MVTAKVAVTEGTYTIAWTAKPDGYFGVTGRNLDSGEGGQIINEIAPTSGRSCSMRRAEPMSFRLRVLA